MKFNNTKYTVWYFSIIENAKRRKTELDYYEEHHILPKSLGGLDIKENLVKLTAKEHYVVHLLLMKCFDDKIARQKMCSAFLYMSKVRNGYTQKRYTSRLYEYHKKIRAEILRNQVAGEGNPMFGRKHSEETKRKISASRKGHNTNTLEGIAVKRENWTNNNPMNDEVILKKMIKSKSKRFILTSPDGLEMCVHNLAEFCRQNNLSNSNLCSVAKGTLKSYKNWTCKQVS